MRSNLEAIDVVLKHETDKAWRVESVDTGKVAWVPKSLCELERVSAHRVVLTIPHDLALEKELI